MKFEQVKTHPFAPLGIRGFLLIASFFPLILFAQHLSTVEIDFWNILTATASTFSFLISAKLVFDQTFYGKLFAVLGCTGSLAGVFLHLSFTPVHALTTLAIYTLAIYFFIEIKLTYVPQKYEVLNEQKLQQARWAARGLIGISLLFFILFKNISNTANVLLLTALIFSQFEAIRWVFYHQTGFHRVTNIFANIILFALSIMLTRTGLTWIVTLGSGSVLLLLLPGSSYSRYNTAWLEPITAHPARVTLVTFLLLCVLGTIMLSIPSATTSDVSIIDSAFTSVSAVCVTGLTIL